jgi:sterol desaturase/sphingolipid hydroxylase (fatty acid hydroxylase superfamily)
MYYVWAAFIQESIEHDQNFDLYPVLTSGKWHMMHHRDENCNYGVIIPIWDIVFGTMKSHNIKEER